MMISMFFLPGLGLRHCQHGFGEFIAAVDHDTLFNPDFVHTEADYRFMAQLTNTPFDYPVHPYNMSLADYFVRALVLHAFRWDY